MEETKKDNLPQSKMEETTEISAVATTENEEKAAASGNKIESPIESEVDLENPIPLDRKDKIETTPEGSDLLGISDSETANKLEEGDDSISTNIKFDDKLDNHITELLQSNLNTSVQDVKKDFLIIFGLFASFVTFISINVQVFKNNDNIFELLGICSISLSFIIFFATIINGMVKDKGEWKDILKPTFVFTFLFLAIGIIFLSVGNSKNAEMRKEIEKRLLKDSVQLSILESDIKLLHNKLNKTDSNALFMKLRIDSIENKQNVDTNKIQKKQPGKSKRK